MFGLLCPCGSSPGAIKNEMLLKADVSSLGFFCPTAFPVTSKRVAQVLQIISAHFDFV